MCNTQPDVRSTTLDKTSTPTGRPPRITSGSLFGNHTEVIIEHAGQEYRLRITRQGKLILTK